MTNWEDQLEREYKELVKSIKGKPNSVELYLKGTKELLAKYKIKDYYKKEGSWT